MANMYYDADAKLERLQDRKIAVMGYGSQGHAHALNLQDSGCKVAVGLREGSGSWETATQAGLTVMPVAQAANWADMVMIFCLLYTSPSPRDRTRSRMPSSA